jgi:hypothetical protein
MIVLDPGRYRTDRLLASPVAPLVAVSTAAELLGADPNLLVAVRRWWQLEIAQDRSLLLRPPYLPAPSGLDLTEAPVQLLLPAHRDAFAPKP